MDDDFRADAREGGYALGGNIMLGAIVILFAVVVFLTVLHFYARWYLRRARRRNRQRANRIVFYVDPNAAAPTRGLDPSLLTSLPVFAYSSKTHQEALECAVCLSEFEDNEKGRLLPKCQHSFHVDCIDMWFHSHSSCPLCRSPVEPDIPVHSPRENQTDHVVLSIGDPGETEPGSSSGQGVCSTCQHDGVPIGSTTSLVDRRKGLSLDVTIEVPRMSESEGESRLSSPASQGFKSPGNRLLSLKRILSFNRKTLAVSPSSEIGTSCGHEVTESRNESTHGQTPAQTPR